MKMNSSLYKNLKKCDAKEAWYAVRDIVCAQLMGENTFGVPFLEEASTYNVGYVVLKEARSPMEKLGRRTPAAIPVGIFTDFVNEQNTTTVMLASNMLGSVQENKGTLNQDYTFREYDMKNGLKKELVVKIEGCTHSKLGNNIDDHAFPMAFSKRGYQHLTKFYLIPSVFYANKIHVCVAFNDQADEFSINQKIPIGFQLWKYKMDQDENVISAKELVDPNKWKVLWIHKRHFRNPMDKLPDVPIGNFTQQNHDDEDAEGYLTLPGTSSRAN